MVTPALALPARVALVVLVVSAVTLILIRVVVVVTSMAVVVQVTGLEIDGCQARLQGGGATADALLSEILDDGNEDVGVQGSVVLLREAEWSSFPV